MPASFSRFLVVAAALFIVAAGLRVTADFLAPLILGGFVVVLGVPLVEALERRGWPHWLAVGAAIGLYIAAVAVLALVGLVSVRELAELRPAVEDGAARFEGELAAAVAGLAGESAASVAAAVHLGDVLPVADDVASGLISAAVLVGLAGLVAVYGLIGAHRMPGVALSALGSRPGAREGWRRYSDGLRTFFGARAVLGLAMAVLAGAWLAILGQDLALFWAVVAFFFSFVPNVGLLLSMVGPALIALLTDGWPTALAVVAGYSVINLVIDYVLQPRMMARQLNLSPLVVFVSLLLWAALLGPIGALLAIPMTLGLQVLLASFDDSRWAATLLGNEPPEWAEAPATDVGPQADATSGD